MSEVHARRRTALCLLLATSPAIWSHSALAIDKASCVAAAEEGQRLRRQGQLLAARDQLEVCANPDCPEIVARDCQGWLDELHAIFASLVVEARGGRGEMLSEVDVIVDGNKLPERPPTKTLEVAPGEHVVRCERSGFAPWETHIKLAEGERDRTIVCVFSPPAPPPPPRSLMTSPIPAPTAQPHAASSRTPWVLWPLAGLGVAGVGAFAALGLSGRADENALKGSCAPYCKDEQVNPIATKFTIANISLGVGAVALGAAALVALFHATSAPPSTPADGKR